MSGLFGLGRKKAENEVEQEATRAGTGTGTGTGTGVGTGSGVGTGTGTGSGYGSTSQRGNVGSEEARNLNYEGTTASGARSGATGATSQLEGRSGGTGTGSGVGTGSNVNRGTTGTGVGTGTGATGTRTGATGGVSDAFRGLNITHQSGFARDHPVVGDTGIVCDTKYYTAVEDRPIIKEIKTYIREHHPVEKEFVVETRPTGQEREQVSNRSSEVVDTKERIVEVTQADPCGGVPTAEYGTGVTGTRGATGTGVTGSTGTGVTGGRTGTTTGTGYGTGASSGTGGGVASYIPGTESYRETHGGQNIGGPRTGSSTNTGYSGTGTGTGTNTGYGSGTGSGSRTNI